jgi:hypothetical protein
VQELSIRQRKKVAGLVGDLSIGGLREPCRHARAKVILAPKVTLVGREDRKEQVVQATTTQD